MIKECIICKNKFGSRSNAHKVCDNCKKRKCKVCGKDFLLVKNDNRKYRGFYCSRNCYLKNRWKKSDNCLKCGKKCELRFCSRKCQKSYWDINGYSLGNKKRIWLRKEKIISQLGGKCIKCGNKDIRVLDINHIDRLKKGKLKNYSWTKRFQEWERNITNLELLCANCHRIHTWEQMNYGKGKPVIKR